MLRRDLLRTSAAIGITSIAGCTGQSSNFDFTDGFEDGIGEWDTRATIGPEVDLADFEWEMDI
jgi:hypothetical protein